jgi:DNA-binding GntR family transcriptional regulator
MSAAVTRGARVLADEGLIVRIPYRGALVAEGELAVCD